RHTRSKRDWSSDVCSSDLALSNEFATVIQEVRLGRPRLEALDEMGRRCGVDDLHNFCQAVVQSEQMGIGVAKILRLQSEEMRRKIGRASCREGEEKAGGKG